MLFPPSSPTLSIKALLLLSLFLSPGLASPCPLNCAKCVSPSECSLCQDRYFLTESKSCLSCGYNCKECSKTECKVCNTGYGLIGAGGQNEDGTMVNSDACYRCYDSYCDNCDYNIGKCRTCSKGYDTNTDGMCIYKLPVTIAVAVFVATVLFLVFLGYCCSNYSLEASEIKLRYGLEEKDIPHDCDLDEYGNPKPKVYSDILKKDELGSDHRGAYVGLYQNIGASNSVQQSGVSAHGDNSFLGSEAQNIFGDDPLKAPLPHEPEFEASGPTSYDPKKGLLRERLISYHQ